MARIRSGGTLDHSTGTTLVIHDLRIDLRHDVDIEGLIAEILTGVRDGGSVVRVVGRWGSQYDLIVTPTTRATISQRAPMSDDHSHDGAWLTGLDLDY